MAEQQEVERDTGTMSREQLVNLVVEKFEKSVSAFGPHMHKMARWYDLQRGIYSSRYQAFRNNIHIPLLFSIIQSDIARKVGMLLGQSPYVVFTGGGPEDASVAKKQESLVNVQLEDARTLEKAVDYFYQADLYGTAVCRWFWEVKEGDTALRADLGQGEQWVNSPTTKFNGPNWEPVDIVDFFPPPGYARVRDMPGVVHRFWLDLEDVVVHAERGYYDRSGVKDLTYAPPSPSVMEGFTWRRGLSPGLSTQSEARWDKFQKPVEILEYWGRVPRNLAPDGRTNRVITVANRKHLLRNRPNMMPGERIPFLAFSPTPDPHYFHAPGKAEIAAKLQYASNRIANQKMDALDLVIDPFFLYNRRSGFDPRNLRIRPLGCIGVDGPVDDTMIRPLSPDIRGLQNAYTELEQQSRWMQQGTGIVEDVVQGFGTADRQTAREFVGRQEAVSNRLLLEARIAEKAWLEPLAEVFVELDRWFLPFPQEVKMIGGAAIMDPVTLQPIPKTMMVGVNDLLRDYDIKAVGATRQLGAGARQQNMVLLLQYLQTNPAAIQMVNWMAFFRELFQVFEIPNVDQLLNTDPLQQQLQAQGSSGGKGGGPKGRGNGREPGTLDPALLQSMLMGGLGGQQGA